MYWGYILTWETFLRRRNYIQRNIAVVYAYWIVTPSLNKKKQTSTGTFGLPEPGIASSLKRESSFKEVHSRR